MPTRLLYSILGIILGLSVPFNWLLWHAYSSRRAWWLTWLKTEFHRNGNIYIPLTLGAVTFFAVLGYFLGKITDDVKEEARQVRDSNAALSELASTDGLTGLFNARYIHEQLDLELENAYESPLTCFLIDIDHFKRINDTKGHPFGDAVLVQIGSILRRLVRRMDVVGRFGGEEFMILLPNTPADRAVQVAERIREAVKKENFIHDEKTIGLTVSIGVVTVPAPGLTDKRSLIKAVDNALYAAKRSGRNRVVVWAPDEKEPRVEKLAS